MPELSLMVLDEGSDRNIRCRFVCNWSRVDSYVTSKERMLSEIEKNKPDVVMLDIGLYEKIDGIETSHMIRNLFGVQVMYV